MHNIVQGTGTSIGNVTWAGEWKLLLLGRLALPTWTSADRTSMNEFVSIWKSGVSRHTRICCSFRLNFVKIMHEIFYGEPPLSEAQR